MMTSFPITRELLGKFGQSGWRPLVIGWGLSLALVALAWVLVYRFAIGATTSADLIALGGAILPLMQYIHLRGAPMPPSPTGGLINDAAIA